MVFVQPVFSVSKFIGSPPIHRSGSLPLLSPANLAAPRLPPPPPSKPSASPRLAKKLTALSQSTKVKSKFYFGDSSSTLDASNNPKSKTGGAALSDQNKLFVQTRAHGQSSRSVSSSLDRLGKPSFKSHLMAPFASVGGLKSTPKPTVTPPITQPALPPPPTPPARTRGKAPERPPPPKQTVQPEPPAPDLIQL